MDRRLQDIGNAILAERRRVLSNLEVYRGVIEPDVYRDLVRAFETAVDLKAAMALPPEERPIGWHWPDIEKRKPRRKK